MSHPIPLNTQSLIARLRHTADELESAARYGVPIPSTVSVSEGEYGEARFATYANEYGPWLEYSEGTEREYIRDDRRWRSVEAVIGEHDLKIAFATSEPIAAEVTS